jgi:tetratricopeptide (TPR) repeat protein
MNTVSPPQEPRLSEGPALLEERIRLLWTQESWEEMARQCARMQSLYPDWVSAYSLEAVALREGGRLEEAVARVESALTRFPEELALWVERAWIELARGHFSPAAERWQVIRERFAAHPEGWSGGAQTLLRAGRHAEAESLVCRGCERFPEHAEMLILSAFVAIERHDWDAAQYRWQQVRDRFPQREEAAHWLKQVPLLRALEESAPAPLEQALPADRCAPRVACIMMQKDEDHLLEPWLAYHGYLFGFENLIVYDNGSTSPTVHALLRKYAAAGVAVIRDKDRAEDFTNKGWILSARIRELQRRRQYDIVFPLDCDEFVCITSRHGFSCSRAEISRYLASLEPGNIYRVARSLTNQPGSSTVFRVTGHGKSVIGLGRFKLMDHGFHEAELEGVTEYQPTRLINIHMHNKPFGTLLEHARLKLRPFVDVDDPQALARFDGCGVHLKRYFSLTEAEYHGETGPWPLVRFTGFGRLLAALMDFAAFEAAWCGSMEATHPAHAAPGLPAVLDIDGSFDARAYLEANPDARESGLEPIVHYLEVGRLEGRPLHAGA